MSKTFLWRPRGDSNPRSPPLKNPRGREHWIVAPKLAEECWNWSGRVQPGHAHKPGFATQERQPHRIVWEAFHGPVVDGLLLCHRCDNPRCCNPNHLFLGTHQDNVADRVAKDRSAKGSRNGRSTLTELLVYEARCLHVQGISIRELARRYGVDRQGMGRALKGVTWKHVPFPTPSLPGVLS